MQVLSATLGPMKLIGELSAKLAPAKRSVIANASPVSLEAAAESRLVTGFITASIPGRPMQDQSIGRSYIPRNEREGSSKIRASDAHPGPVRFVGRTLHRFQSLGWRCPCRTFLQCSRQIFLGCVSKVVEIGFGASPSGLSFAAVRPRGQGFRRRLADRGFPIHRLCASGFGRKRGAPRGASALFRVAHPVPWTQVCLTRRA